MHCTERLVMLSLTLRKLGKYYTKLQWLYTTQLNLLTCPLLAVCDVLGEHAIKRGQFTRTWETSNLKLKLAETEWATPLALTATPEQCKWTRCANVVVRFQESCGTVCTIWCQCELEKDARHCYGQWEAANLYTPRVQTVTQTSERSSSLNPSVWQFFVSCLRRDSRKICSSPFRFTSFMAVISRLRCQEGWM